MNILRTAAGSPPSVSQYKAFQSLGCRIIAADCNSESVGFHFAEASYVVPRVDSDGYLDRIVEICKRESVDIFLPALDEELKICAQNRDRFNAVGTLLLVSDPSAIAICTDKLSTFNFFQKIGVSTPKTIAALDYHESSFDSYPLIVKPRSGRGSTGVYRTRNQDETIFFCNYVDNAVVQECLIGIEYTIDVLADMESELLVFSARKRLATDSGISSKGVTDWREDFIDPVRKVVKALNLVGPLCMQCFLSPEGVVTFIEINARMAGTSILSQAAGVPYYESILALARGERPVPWIKPSERLIMYRYWEECFRKIDG